MILPRTTLAVCPQVDAAADLRREPPVTTTFERRTTHSSSDQDANHPARSTPYRTGGPGEAWYDAEGGASSRRVRRGSTTTAPTSNVISTAASPSMEGWWTASSPRSP
jgi:hypothetical protein